MVDTPIFTYQNAILMLVIKFMMEVFKQSVYKNLIYHHFYGLSRIIKLFFNYWFRLKGKWRKGNNFNV